MTDLPQSQTPLSALAAAVLGVPAPSPGPDSTGGASQPTPLSDKALDNAKIVFELVMRGIDPQEITKITGMSAGDVDKVLMSQWFEREAKGRLKRNDDPESLRQYLRVLAFRATMGLGKLMTDPSPNIRLGAIKCVLEYAIKPMRMVDADDRDGSVDLDSVRSEIKQMEQKLSVLNKQSTK